MEKKIVNENENSVTRNYVLTETKINEKKRKIEKKNTSKEFRYKNKNNIILII